MGLQPWAGVAVAWTSLHHGVGTVKAVIQSYECLAVGVKSVDGGVHAIVSIVVAAFAVFGLVVNHRPFYLHLSCREVALEILHVGGGIPQAPFLEREEFQRARLVGGVGECEFLHLAPTLQRHEEENAGLNAVFCRGDARVTHAMTALVVVEWGFAGLPPRVPYAVAIFQVEIPPAIVHRHVVVAVAGNAAELGVFVEGVASCGVGDQ